MWKAHSNKPFFRRPDGKRIFLTVDHYVPYLLTDLDIVAPAAGESGDESEDEGCEDELLTNPTSDENIGEDKVLTRCKRRVVKHPVAASVEEVPCSGNPPDGPPLPVGSGASSSSAGTRVGASDASASRCVAGSGSLDARASAGGVAGSGVSDVPVAGGHSSSPGGPAEGAPQRALARELEGEPDREFFEDDPFDVPEPEGLLSFIFGET